MAVNLPVSGFLIRKMIIMILALVKYFEICGGKVIYKDRHCYFKGTENSRCHTSGITQ